MTGDFLIGALTGGMIGAALGVMLMAALVAASNADDVREGCDGRSRSGVAGSDDLDADGAADGAVGGEVRQ